METFFKAGERGSSVGQEVRAGLTTFLAMAYIIAVNPSLLTAAGIPAAAAVTSTCLGAGIMTILMGLIANRPLACASGMGVNAVFAFTLTGIAEHIPAFRRELDQITDRKEEIIEAAEIQLKYEGYIERERMIADKLLRLEAIKIKGRFDYNSIRSLSTEARQKLSKIDPETIAQASRIPGVSPSDINVLLLLAGR